jgi:hypothetical protein
MPRTILNPLGFLLAGLAIGYVLARSLARLTRRDEWIEMRADVAFPPGSEAEREWRAGGLQRGSWSSGG